MIVPRDERIAELESALSDAIEDIEHWASYAGDYFRDKWDLYESLHEYKSILHRKETP